MYNVMWDIFYKWFHTFTHKQGHIQCFHFILSILVLDMIPTWVFTNSFILNIIWFKVRSTQSVCRIEHLRDYLLRLFCKQPVGCSASTSQFCCFKAFITPHLVNTHWGGLLRLPAAHFHILNFIFWHLHSKWEVGIWRRWLVNCPGAGRWRWRGGTVSHRDSWMGCHSGLARRREESTEQKSWKGLRQKYSVVWFSSTFLLISYQTISQTVPGA